MPRIEEYVVHWQAEAIQRGYLFPRGVCGQVSGGVHLVVGDEEFLRRAAGVCLACARDSRWKDQEKKLLKEAR